MLKSIKKNRDGFTIIEVLIVLAIAALIMIIVFLAVPALQRSARNTQRRTDVSAVVAAISNYISDNNGNVPNDITIATNKVATISCVPTTGTTLPTTSCDKTNLNTETAKMGYYTSNPVISATDASPTAPTTSTISNAQMYYDPDTSCNNNGAPSATTGAFTVWYSPEGGTSVICLD
jgi:prepilin-type N-terminal cleavage/methylation domain-containing protein